MSVRYAEALPFLYTLNHFDFIHSEVLDLFKSHTPPHSFQSIRSIQLNRCGLSPPWLMSSYAPETFYIDRHGNPLFEQGSEESSRLGEIIFGRF